MRRPPRKAYASKANAERGTRALRLVAKNGEVIARGQAYSSKSDATRAVTRLTQMLSSNVNVLTLP